MLVTAIKPAFHNGRRVRVGAVVEVPDDHKGSWFVANDTPAARAAKAKPAKAEPKALSELGGEASKSFNDVHAKADLA